MRMSGPFHYGNTHSLLYARTRETNSLCSFGVCCQDTAWRERTVWHAKPNEGSLRLFLARVCRLFSAIAKYLSDADCKHKPTGITLPIH